MVDRDDDRHLDIGSTAILAGERVDALIATLLVATLGLWLWMGIVLEAGTSFYVGIAVVAGLFGMQLVLVRQPNNRQGWFVAFKSNIWVGTALFVGTALGIAT